MQEEGTIRQQVGTKQAAAVPQTGSPPVPTIQALPVMSELQVSADVQLNWISNILKYIEMSQMSNELEGKGFWTKLLLKNQDAEHRWNR